MNYKIKNLLYTFLFTLAVSFAWVYGFFLNEDWLVVKSNIIFWYLGFLLFYFIIGNIIYLLEIAKKDRYNWKSSTVVFVFVLIFSLLPMVMTLILYEIKLGTNQMIFYGIIFVIFYLLLIYYNSQFSKSIISFGLHKNFNKEFVNKNAWFLIFHRLKYKFIEDKIIFYDKKNYFIVFLYNFSEEEFLMQFKEEKIIRTRNRQPLEVEVEEMIDIMDAFQENKKEIDLIENPNPEVEIITEVIEANDNAQLILDSYEKLSELEYFNYIIAVFFEYSKVNVRGEVPDWFYWNDKNNFGKYITKLKKVNNGRKLENGQNNA